MFPSRSRAIQEAITEKLERLNRNLLAQECAKLDSAYEQGLAEEDLQAGRRPVLILSHDIFNQRSGTVVAMAITSQPQKAGFPLTYRLENSCLPMTSWVKISQIRTLSVERIGDRIGRIDPEELTTIIDGFNQIVSH